MGYFNPLLRLPSAQKILALPDSPEKRLLEQLLRELRTDADQVAEESWKRREGIMGAYWRAVSTYARHCAHAFSRATASCVRVDGEAQRRLRENRLPDACEGELGCSPTGAGARRVLA